VWYEPRGISDERLPIEAHLLPGRALELLSLLYLPIAVPNAGAPAEDDSRSRVL
jgi:hypothetical protein